MDLAEQISARDPDSFAAGSGVPLMALSPVATTAACIIDASRTDHDVLKRDLDVLIAGAQFVEGVEEGVMWRALPGLCGARGVIRIWLVGPEARPYQRLLVSPSYLAREGQVEIRFCAESVGAFASRRASSGMDVACAYSPGFGVFYGSWIGRGNLQTLLGCAKHVYVSSNPGIDGLTDRACLFAHGFELGEVVADMGCVASDDPESWQVVCTGARRVVTAAAQVPGLRPDPLVVARGYCVFGRVLAALDSERPDQIDAMQSGFALDLDAPMRMLHRNLFLVRTPAGFELRVLSGWTVLMRVPLRSYEGRHPASSCADAYELVAALGEFFGRDAADKGLLTAILDPQFESLEGADSPH